MRKLTVLVVAASLLTGCATVTDFWHKTVRSPGAAPPRQAPTNAVEAAKPQKKARAKTGSGSDQLLFRRALLALKPNREAIVTKRSRQLLDRLKKEYPSSPWAAPATRVNELIDLADELSRQNRELKSANESLSREVEQLNYSIDQMKHLDMELEKSR